MIEVIIRHVDTDSELARVEIENISPSSQDVLGTYSIRFAVERISSIGLHQRLIDNFPKRQYNVLALLRQALMTLDNDELKLEGEWTHRRFRKALPGWQTPG
jgi:hypothetical protein